MNSIPGSPSTELNLVDLELLHQYLTSTCIPTGQLPETTTHVQATVLPLAQAHPFVMHGMLAMAATHLSQLRPSRQAYYAMLSAKNHENALPEFRLALQDINSKNCHALIAYSKALVWCLMASDESSSQMRVAPGVECGWLPQWFPLLRGSCQIVEYSRTWIKEGPHVLQKLDSTVDYSETLGYRQISTLMSQLLPLTESLSCEIVLIALRESFVRASIHHHNTPFRNAINFWIGSLPDEYVVLLQKKEPWTLVALAHFCVLVHQCEFVWFMKGHATRLLLSIVECLDSTWRCYVQWPCKELGID